jgi:hypothetical protein
MKLLIMQFPPPPVTSSLLGRHPPLFIISSPDNDHLGFASSILFLVSYLQWLNDELTRRCLKKETNRKTFIVKIDYRCLMQSEFA